MDDEIREAMEAYIQGQSDFQNANALSIESLEKSKKGYDGLTDKQRDAVRATQAFTAGLKRTLSDFRTNAGRVSAFGGVVDGVGVGLRKMGFAGHMAAEALEAIAGLTFDEVDRTIENFNKMANIGAIGAEAMSGFRNQAHSASLTMEQFTRIMTQSAESMALASGSTTEGARALSQLTQAAGDSGLRRQLRMLGLDVEAQSQFFGEYLESVRLLGLQQNRDYRGQAQSAANYVKQLDLLARITGQTREAAQAELEAQQRSARFNAAMQDLAARQGAEYANRVRVEVAALGNKLGPAAQQMLMDIFAGPNTQGARDFLVAFGVEGREMIEQVKAGTADLGELSEMIVQRGMAGRERFGGARQLGLLAETGVMDNVVSALLNIPRAAELNRAELQKLVDAQRITDPLTNDLVRAQEASQQTAVNLERTQNIFLNFGATVLPTFTETVQDLSGILRGFVDWTGWSDLGISTRASGGPVSPGGSYLVGEQGPELVQFAGQANILDAARTRNVQEQIAKLFSDPKMLQEGFETAMGESISLASGGAGGIKIAGAQGTSYYDTQGNFLKQVMPTLAEGLTQTYNADGSVQQRYSAGGLNIIDLFGADGAAKSRRSEYGFSGNSLVEERNFETGEVRSRGYNQYDTNPDRLMFDKQGAMTSNDVKMMKEMVDALYKIADNTASGADTSKKLLRASSS